MKWKYIGRRIAIIIPTFFGITLLAYILASLAPGSPLDLLLANSNMTDIEYERMRAVYGLDKPVVIQYFNWLIQLFHGNLGTSYRTGEAVLKMVLARLGPTMMVTVTATALSVIISIPLGTMAAIHPNTLWDYIASGLSFVAASMPNFFVCLLLVYVLSVQLQLLPTSGMYTTASNKNFIDLLRHLIMPVIVICFQQLGNMIRQMRGSMLDVMEQDYIRTCREKGLSERKVIWRHGVRNALIPMVTTIGLNIPFIIGGAVVTEQIFSWPGLGSLMVQSINARDYPCIMGITVFVAGVVLIGNLIVDLVYGILDPRISYS